MNEEFDIKEVTDLELELTSLQVKDFIAEAQRDGANVTALLARLYFNQVKLESMVGYLLARQQTEMLRSPRPGEVIMGNKRTTKIKYFRDGLEEFHDGPWRRYLQRAIDQKKPKDPPAPAPDQP